MPKLRTFSMFACAAALLALVPIQLCAQGLIAAPDRKPGEGMGPFKRLVIRGVTVIDGTGAAPQGPMDVVVEGGKIADVVDVGVPHRPIDPKKRPAKGDYEIDGTGMYLLPGFVDTHVHYGDAQKAPQAEYANKLWLAHGVTTVRGVPGGPLDWTLKERERSSKNEIVAPHIFVYQPAFSGDGWKGSPELTPELGRKWVDFIADKGADGVKLFGGDPEVVAAILDEARKRHLGSLAHLGQESEPRLTARIAVDLGLRTVTHSYGLFESLLKDTSIQNYPVGQNYNDDSMRFGQIARNWDKVYPRGSAQWNDFLADLKAHDATMNPTLAIYSAGRDLMRAYTAEWHDKYTLPSLMSWPSTSPSSDSRSTFNCSRHQGLLRLRQSFWLGAEHQHLPGLPGAAGRAAGAQREGRRVRHAGGAGHQLPGARALHLRAQELLLSRPAQGLPDFAVRQADRRAWLHRSAHADGQ
jgi:hypothetical protein